MPPGLRKFSYYPAVELLPGEPAGRAVCMNGPAVTFGPDQVRVLTRYLLRRRLALPGRLVIAMTTIAATTVTGIRIILSLLTIESPLITM